MSWEEINITKIKCPCGKGLITQRHYGDDWNRYEDGPIEIECAECKKIYRIESKISRSYKPHYGDSTTYYLTPINYPSYVGISEKEIFGNLCNNIREVPFSSYLIENYSSDDLKMALEEYVPKRSSSKVRGIAAKICKEHRRWKNSVKASLIIQELKTAIADYASYYGSYEQREPVRNQEKRERELYLEEKRKHQIKLEL